MEIARKNKGFIVSQFFLWWGIYFLFFILVFLVPMRLVGRVQGPAWHDIVLTVGCTGLAAAMAVSHYYLLYRTYLAEKKYFIYLASVIGFFALFILLDAILFYTQIGTERFFSDTASRMLVILSSRVLIAYAPVVLVYTLVRRFRDKRKEAKIS